MQISTRDEDYIIDTLELRSEMYILNETFTDPSIVKVVTADVCVSAAWFAAKLSLVRLTCRYPGDAEGGG